MDAFAAAAVTLALLWALRQYTFYKDDAHVYLLSILQGDETHPHHMLFKPAVAALHRACAPLGLSLYEAGLALSALGTAAGVGCAHLATRCLGCHRRTAWRVTALVVSAPALLFFGTVVEVHGFYLAFAGLAFLATAALARRPSPARGALLGLAAAFAYLGHASAGLLLAPLLPIAYFHAAGGRPPVRAFVAAAATALAVQAVGILGLGWLGRTAGLGADTADAARYVLRDALAFAADPGRWASTLWHEWLAPYAPLQLVALAACFAGGHRPEARWLLLAVVPYWLLAVFLLPSAEYGAYLTPFAWPLALLAMRLLGPRRALGVAGVGLALGIAWVARYDEPELAERYARGVREVAGGRPPFLLLGDHADGKAYLIALPDVPHLLLLRAGEARPEDFPAVMAAVEGLLRDRLREGHAVLLTAGARALLEQVAPSGPRVAPALAERLALVPVRARGPGAEFAGELVLAR